MSKHTPGPWLFVEKFHDGIYTENGSPNVWTIETAQDTLMADSSYYPWVPTNKADWRLIAAAPDLLDACRKALYAIKGREHDQFIRDAIAKATGEQS